MNAGPPPLKSYWRIHWCGQLGFALKCLLHWHPWEIYPSCAQAGSKSLNNVPEIWFPIFYRGRLGAQTDMQVWGIPDRIMTAASFCTEDILVIAVKKLLLIGFFAPDTNIHKATKLVYFHFGDTTENTVIKLQSCSMFSQYWRREIFWYQINQWISWRSHFNDSLKWLGVSLLAFEYFTFKWFVNGLS